MKDCACVYRIYIGKNKEKAQERLIEKYQEFVASGAKEITVKVDETIMEGGNGTTYPYRQFEKAMNYIIRPVSDTDGKDNNGNDNDGNDNDGNDNDGKDSDGNDKEYEEEKGIAGNDGNDGKENEQERDIEKERGIDNIQDIRDFYSKLSKGVVCIRVV